jgi:hypothetical protein
MGLPDYNKTKLSKRSNKVFPYLYSVIAPTPRHSNVIDEDFVSELDSIKEEERKLLVEKKQLLDTLNQLQLESDNIADKKRRLLAEMKKNISPKLENCDSKSHHMLFSVFTWGSSSTYGLVFTVMAESEVWAEELVRQWLNCNGRENHKIDKVMALISRDVRGIINVGAILLDF